LALTVLCLKAHSHAYHKRFAPVNTVEIPRPASDQAHSENSPAVAQARGDDLSPFAQARRAMIDSQLRTSGVNADYVLRRMGEVAREDYVPAAVRDIAYIDRAIALESGGFLPAPLVQGMMLQEAEPGADDHAIVVDGGSGYLAELLRPLVGKLTVLSPADAVGGGQEGKNASLLLIDGAAEELPAQLVALLADGARIVTGTVEGSVTRIAVGRKTPAGASLMPVLDAGIPRITAFDKPKGWSF
jgi:protein-L-isoaspartate(D-aspartate) O-methyltransferase